MSNWPDWLPLRPDLKGLTPYGAPQIKEVTALNTNENPFPLPDKVVKEILDAITVEASNLNRYPDRDALELREALANYINQENKSEFKSQNIWVANGSNEILQTLALAFGSRGAIGFTPSYSMHPLIAKVCGVNWVEGARKTDFSIDSESAAKQISELKPSLVFVTTPNNPTGNAVDISLLKQLAAVAKSVNALLVIDEAYEEFSSIDSSVSLLKEFENVVVVRTMSKAFALAGARVGYLVANPIIVDAALITRLPYHLSWQTQAIAKVALSNYQMLQSEVNLIISERNRVASELRSLGLKVIESEANFLLFTGFSGDEKSVWEQLLKDKVLIRDVGIPGYLRVTIGTPNENDQFLAAIARHRP